MNGIKRDPFTRHIELHIMKFTNTIKSGGRKKLEMIFPFNEIRGLFTVNNFVGCLGRPKSPTHSPMNPDDEK